MKPFYFEDNEGNTMRVEGYKGTIEEFETILGKVEDSYNDDGEGIGKDYDTFYQDLTDSTDSKIELVEIEFSNYG